MNIDVYISGQFFHRWEIEDLKDFQIEGATWQENAQAREALICMHYQHFLKHTFPLLKTLKNVAVYVVMPSKMNKSNEEDEGLTDLDQEIQDSIESELSHFIPEV